MSWSDVLQIALGLTALGGIGYLVVSRRSRRPGSAPDPAVPPAGKTAAEPVLRLSRLTSLSLVVAAIALVVATTTLGLRLADGHDPLAGESTGQQANPTLTVTGRGTAAITFDTAAIVFGVDGSWPTLLQANQIIEAGIGAAAGAGIAPADIQTVSYRVTPVGDGQSTPSPIDGVQVSRRVAVIVRDLNQLDAVLAAVSSAGVSVTGVGIGVGNPAAAYAAARSAAMADARARAESMAESQGTQIIHAEETIEFEPSSVALSPLAIALGDPAAGPPSMSGQVEIKVQVTFSVR